MSESKLVTGTIIKALGGFYYVKSPALIYECRARGVFRKEGITPYVGDRVEIEETEAEKGYVINILPRKNNLVRPPVANIDNLLIVVSVEDPRPNPLVIDKLIAVAVYKGIEPIVAITKTDLASADELLDTYQKAGIKTFCVNSVTGKGVELLKPEFESKITAFTGNSGAGKSSLINALSPKDFELKTGETSKKLGRGRHTTRHVELFELCGGYLADTPGFSSVDVDSFETILKEELADCFMEFEKHTKHCKFRDCAHLNETGCAVRAAVDEGQIAPSRYESYKKMYEDAKKINTWERK